MTSSTVWAVLSVPNPSTAGVPFIDDTNNATIDPANYFYDSVQKILYVRKAIEFDGSEAPGPGNVTMNSAVGIISIAAGDQQVILTNELVSPKAVILASVMTDDATAKSVVVASRATGNCTFKLDAPATGIVSIGFFVVPLGRAVQQA